MGCCGNARKPRPQRCGAMRPLRSPQQTARGILIAWQGQIARRYGATSSSRGLTETISSVSLRFGSFSRIMASPCERSRLNDLKRLVQPQPHGLHNINDGAVRDILAALRHNSFHSKMLPAPAP